MSSFWGNEKLKKNTTKQNKKPHTTLIFGHLGNGLAQELFHAHSLIRHTLRLVYHRKPQKPTILIKILVGWWEKNYYLVLYRIFCAQQFLKAHYGYLTNIYIFIVIASQNWYSWYWKVKNINDKEKLKINLI